MKTEDTIQIDGIDKIILNGLMQDARMSINQLAKQVGISGAAVHRTFNEPTQQPDSENRRYLKNRNFYLTRSTNRSAN